MLYKNLSSLRKGQPKIIYIRKNDLFENIFFYNINKQYVTNYESMTKLIQDILDIYCPVHSDLTDLVITILISEQHNASRQNAHIGI